MTKARVVHRARDLDCRLVTSYVGGLQHVPFVREERERQRPEKG